MKVGLDTSVVLRCLVGEPADQAQVTLDYLGQIESEGGRAIVSDQVVAEAYFALQYHYRVPKAEALSGLRDFLTSDGIESNGVAVAVLKTSQLESAKPGFIDRMIHRQYIEKADAVVTFEKSAHKLPRTVVLAATSAI
jgi:predicted nucleic-acid-binding protein